MLNSYSGNRIRIIFVCIILFHNLPYCQSPVHPSQLNLFNVHNSLTIEPNALFYVNLLFKSFLIEG